jgi:hypothetical protein
MCFATSLDAESRDVAGREWLSASNLETVKLDDTLVWVIRLLLGRQSAHPNLDLRNTLGDG